MSNTSNLIHCQNGHVFSKKRYGTVCPYCNMETDTKEKRETQRSDVEIEEELFREDIKPVCRNHAVIVFDPKKKETVLLPGDANGIVYLNGNAVYAPATLNKYDEIELGKSKFLFVPFCGENFMWGGKTE